MGRRAYPLVQSLLGAAITGCQVFTLVASAITEVRHAAERVAAQAINVIEIIFLGHILSHPGSRLFQVLLLRQLAQALRTPEIIYQVYKSLLFAILYNLGRSRSSGNHGGRHLVIIAPGKVMLADVAHLYFESLRVSGSIS